METLSKAEYLKKYLSTDDKKKKKKPKKTVSSAKANSRFKIIDDTVAVPVSEVKRAPLVPGLILAEDDEADEDRPTVALVDKVTTEELKLMGKFKAGAWKPLSDDKKSDEKRSRQRHDSFSSSDEEQSTSKSNSAPRRRKDSKEKRKNSSSEDLSPPRSKRTRHDSSDDDLKVTRRRRRSSSDSDLSVDRGRSRNSKSGSKKVKREHKSSDDDLSPERPKHSSDRRYKEIFRKHVVEPEIIRDGKMTKTLSGAKAGLQSASSMREEAKMLKDKEAKAFEKLDAGASGRDAGTVFRDRKSGKRRDIEAESAVKEAELKKQKELEDKYKKWNRGVKQLKDREEKLEELAKEVEKPMARYIDDADLEKYQKEKELEEDPMLEYMRKKKVVEKGPTIIYPRYKGPAPAPNRHGIWPGYRWDGVDRSNGFETKIVSTRNVRNADEQEAYKYISGTYE